MPAYHRVPAVGLKDWELRNSCWSSATKAAACYSGPGPDLTPISSSTLHPPVELCTFSLKPSPGALSTTPLLHYSLSYEPRLFLQSLLKPLRHHCSLLFKLYPFCTPYLICINMYIHHGLCDGYELILVIKTEVKNLHSPQSGYQGR